MTVTTSGSVNFDRAAEYYDETRGYPPGVEMRAAELLAAAAQLTPASRVLEIGIGTGRIALPVAPYTADYHGVDISTAMLARLIAKRTAEPVRPLLGDATRLPYPNAAFDAVIAVHIFHLIPDWRAALREVARVLKPGQPLVHAWGARVVHSALHGLWEAIMEAGSIRRGTIAPTDRDAFLQTAGWLPSGAELHLDYVMQQTPNSFIGSLRDRKWSQTWAMEQTFLDRAIAEMTVKAQAEFGDLDAPIAVEQRVRIQAYLPPIA